MGDDRSAPSTPCLTCSEPAARLDGDPPTIHRGKGWAFVKRRILSECPKCKTGPQSRIRLVVEFDEGPHGKRTLR